MSEWSLDQTEVARIKAQAQVEAVSAQPLTDKERQLFRLGFLAGVQEGVAIAQRELATLSREE